MTPLAADSDAFQAIANPTRRAILDRLRQGELSFAEIAKPLRMSAAAVSQQLRILRRVGLVAERRVGRQRIYRLSHEALGSVRDWLTTYEQFWEGTFTRFASYLDAERRSSPAGHGQSRGRRKSVRETRPRTSSEQ